MTSAPLDAAVVGLSRSHGTSTNLPIPATRPVLSELPEDLGPLAPVADGVPQQLVDRYGRTVRDLRLLITSRYNLRYTYCMPAQGLQWLPTPDLLTTTELTRLGRTAVERLGVEYIHLAGGEPLMWCDLEEIVEVLSALRALARVRPDTILITNGLSLEKRAVGLRAAGLDRVNIFIDPLDLQDYVTIARRDRLTDAPTGIAGIQEADLDPIKVGAVAVPVTMEERALCLPAECLRRSWQLRFIEHMPLGPHETWSSQDAVNVDRILEVLREAGFTLTEVGYPDRRPTALWRVAAGSASGQEYPAGTVGVIVSVTATFCSDCDRTRITVDERLMTCLFSSTETDPRNLMCAGADDDELIRIWADATWGKPYAHGSDSPHIESDGFARPQRTMSVTGG